MPTKLDHQLSGILAKIIDRLEDINTTDEKLLKLMAQYAKLMEE